MINYAEYSEEDKLRIQKFPWKYLHLPDLPTDLAIRGIDILPGYYPSIPNPSRDVTLFLVRSNGIYLAIVAVKHQDLEICLEAIRNNPISIKNVKIGITEEMYRECVLSFVRIYRSESWFKLAFDCIPVEILESDSFRRFLIDHGLFEFLGWIK